MNVELVASVLEKEEKGLTCDVLVEINCETKRKQLACAVGALLWRAGWSASRIEKLEGDLTPPTLDRCREHRAYDCDYCGQEHDKRSPEWHALERLKKVYDLTEDEIDSLISVNDGMQIAVDPIERRDRVIAWVREQAK